MIGIYGASGFIGRHLLRHFRQSKQDVMGTYFKRRQPELLAFDVMKDSPSIFDECDVVIVAGAISAMDACSDKPDYTYRVNVEAVARLSRYLADKKIKVVYLSSNQVFDGNRGNYSEDDEPEPHTEYGKQKYQVEQAILGLSESNLVLRLSKVYSRDESEDSLYSLIARKLRKGETVKAAYNQIYNPTDVEYLCQMIGLSIERDLHGVYHLAAEDIMSRYDFAVQIADKLGAPHDLVEAVDIMSFPLKEYPPLNGGMRVTKIIDGLTLESHCMSETAES